MRTGRDQRSGRNDDQGPVEHRVMSAAGGKIYIGIRQQSSRGTDGATSLFQ